MNAIGGIMFSPAMCLAGAARRRHGLAAALMLLLGALAATPASGVVLEVPGGYATIQAAIDAAANGDVVNVAAGVYVEQLEIEKSVTLQGAGRDRTVIQAPAMLAAKFRLAGRDCRPIVYIHAADNVTLRDVVVDGAGGGAGNADFVGVAFHEAGGLVSNAGIRGMHETPFGSTAHGTGLLALSGGGVVHAVTVNGTAIKECQFHGIELRGVDLVAVVEECMLFGPGEEHGLTPPSGIQVADGARATLVGNEISQHLSSCASCGPDPRSQMQAAAIRLEGGDGLTRIEDNLLTENDVAIWAHGGSEIVDNFMMDNRYAGMVLRGGTHSVAGANFQGDHRVGIWVLGEDAADDIELTDLCLNGPGGSAIDPEVIGVRAWSAGTPLDVRVRNCTISQWSVGAKAEGSATRLHVNESSIVSNWIAGYDNTGSGLTQDAEYNWWGAADGPAPAGSGEIILGSVDWNPLLLEEYDTQVTCGLQRRGTEVGPQSPTECLSVANTCIEEVPFEITRTETAQMRGFSVTFQLSDRLDLCSGLASIHEGTYLQIPGGATHMEKHANGGGSYTVDCAILGSPCGQDDPTGTLFTIDVKKKSGSDDGSGTISMSAVTLRNCLNQPIAADLGPDAEVTVDTQPPAAVADLAATQVKTGNGADQTTFITLTFSPPGDATEIEVYRAPYGHYPEYDDDGGSVPGAPGYPPAAPWTLTTISGSGQNDEPAERDFWYYAVFTKDACENVSAVSNLTGGTLNYHLGDVTNGVPGTGNNDVNTGDVSTLSSTYWKGHGEGGYLNYCDVGPTADGSVDALPATDNAIGFEDLMIFSMNFEEVALAGGERAVEIAEQGLGDRPRLVLVIAPGTPRLNTIAARLVLEGNTRTVKGIRAVVSLPAGGELVNLAWGSLLAGQGGPVFNVHQVQSGKVLLDVAALGRGLSLQGSGEIAVLELRLGGAAGRPVLESADLRDARNRLLGAATDLLAQPPAQRPVGETILRTELVGVRPNPFLGTTEIVFGLAAETAVALRVYDTGGRLVRTLAAGALPAGEHRMIWDGRLDSGAQASSGVYLCTFQAGEVERCMKMFYYR